MIKILRLRSWLWENTLDLIEDLQPKSSVSKSSGKSDVLRIFKREFENIVLQAAQM